MRVDLFDFELPEDQHRAASRGAARCARACSWSGPRPASRIAASATCRTCCSRATCWCSTTPRSSRRGSTACACATETAARVEIMLHKRESADRWRAFARPAKKLACRRPHPLRRKLREHGLRARAPRCRGRGERRGGRGGPALRRSPAPSSTRPSPASANCRCRPTSPASGRPTTRTAPTTRPSTPGTRAPSPRRPPACISPTSSSAVSTSAASAATS